MTPRERLLQAMAALGIEVRATLLPQSRHRACSAVHRHLRWMITLVLRGRDVLTEYSASVHAPFVRRPAGTPPDRELRDFELECGLHAHRGPSGEIVPGEAIRPDPVEVVADVLLDVEAIDAREFEHWTQRLGIAAVADSRDYALYQRGLEVGSEMGVALGEIGLARLREAACDVLSPAQRALGHAIHRVAMRDERSLGRGDETELVSPPLSEVFVLSCVLEAGMDAIGARRRGDRWEIALADGCDYDRLARLSRLLHTTRIWIRPDVELAREGETTAATDGLALTIADREA